MAHTLNFNRPDIVSKGDETYKVLEVLLFWSLPFITNVHIPGGGKQSHIVAVIIIIFSTILKQCITELIFIIPDLLVKISEHVDPEGVLLVQFVAISVLHSLLGLGGGQVLEEDVSTQNNSKVIPMKQHSAPGV